MRLQLSEHGETEERKENLLQLSQSLTPPPG